MPTFPHRTDADEARVGCRDPDSAVDDSRGHGDCSEPAVDNACSDDDEAIPLAVIGRVSGVSLSRAAEYPPGAMLFIRIVLVPFWQGASSSEFTAWFAPAAASMIAALSLSFRSAI